MCLLVLVLHDRFTRVLKHFIMLWMHVDWYSNLWSCRSLYISWVMITDKVKWNLDLHLLSKFMTNISWDEYYSAQSKVWLCHKRSAGTFLYIDLCDIDLLFNVTESWKVPYACKLEELPIVWYKCWKMYWYRTNLDLLSKVNSLQDEYCEVSYIYVYAKYKETTCYVTGEVLENVVVLCDHVLLSKFMVNRSHYCICMEMIKRLTVVWVQKDV